jgi:uncharacterized protein (TIGR02996 family)
MDSSNLQNLNSVLKYHQEAERAAFESAIDANPLESTNHLVYADWLQERAETSEEHQEAEFRRKMGKWFQSGNRSSSHDYAIDELPNNFTNHWYPFGSPSLGAELYTGRNGKRRLRFNDYRQMEKAFREVHEHLQRITKF